MNAIQYARGPKGGQGSSVGPNAGVVMDWKACLVHVAVDCSGQLLRLVQVADGSCTGAVLESEGDNLKLNSQRAQPDCTAGVRAAAGGQGTSASNWKRVCRSSGTPAV